MSCWMTTISLTSWLLVMANTTHAQLTTFDPPTPVSETVVRIADIASYVTVGALLALDAKDAWQADDRRHAVSLFAARIFVNWAWAETVKGLADRERPDGSDRKSFYSLHQALACSTRGGTGWKFFVPLSIGTGIGRVLGKKHFFTDVLAGCVVGALSSTIR